MQQRDNGDRATGVIGTDKTKGAITMKRITYTMVLLGLLATGCGKATSAETSKPKPAVSQDIVATVNGVAISNREVRLRSKTTDGHKDHKDKNNPEAATHGKLDGVLETVIREEMAAQKAKELGLDSDPKYQEGLLQLEAQVAAYRRKALSELFWERHVEKNAMPTDAEAKAYFEKNKDQIRTQLHVKQILRKGRASIDEAKKQLDSGKSFDEVAKSITPNLAPGETPWDLGYLSFYKVPEAWRSVVYNMESGKVSDVIGGQNDRYWIIMVLDKKVDQSIDFESVKTGIITDLKRQKVDAAREKASSDLVNGAKVDRIKAPTPEAPPLRD